MSKRILLVKTSRDKLLKLREDLIKANPGCKWSDNAVEVGDVVYVLKVVSLNRFPLNEITGFDPECVDASDLIDEMDDILQNLIMVSKKIKDKIIHPEEFVEAKSELKSPEEPENMAPSATTESGPGLTPTGEKEPGEPVNKDETKTTMPKPNKKKRHHRRVKKDKVVNEPESIPEEPKL
jgi:hypothetical protein